MKTKVVFIILLGLVLVGCGDTIHGKALAEPKVEVFHEQLNGKRFDEIYNTAGEDFRKAASKEKVLELFAAINRKLGAAKISKTVNWNVRTFNSKTTISLVEETDFEQGRGTETFAFLIVDGRAELVGYNINSTDMLTK